jgi:hypothetical protein
LEKYGQVDLEKKKMALQARVEQCTLATPKGSTRYGADTAVPCTLYGAWY